MFRLSFGFYFSPTKLTKNLFEFEHRQIINYKRHHSIHWAINVNF